MKMNHLLPTVVSIAILAGCASTAPRDGQQAGADGQLRWPMPTPPPRPAVPTRPTPS